MSRLKIKKAQSEKSTRVAIAVSDKNLDSLVDARFGRCPYFLIIEDKINEFEAIENMAGQSFRGAGITAAQMIANKGIKVVIAGNFGPNAINVLSNSGIRIFQGVSGITAEQAFNQYKEGKLKETTEIVKTPPGQNLDGCKKEDNG